MPIYEYETKHFLKESQDVEIPDDAVGVTVDTFPNLVSVKYLVPVEE